MDNETEDQAKHRKGRRKRPCDQMLTKINGLSPAPMSELGALDVFVAGCNLVGEELTSHQGKFRHEQLPGLAELTVGAPLMVGHDKSERPIGRFFDASIVEKMVLASFYVPSARSDAEDLMIDLDAGIAAEASISFAFTKPTCSECGKDMRSYECDHYPGKDGAFFYFDGVTSVLEGSIVFRGAHPGTGFVNLAETDDYLKMIEKRFPKSRVFVRGGIPVTREVI